MILRELFDRSLPYEWTTKLPGDRYVAKFMVGRHEYRFSAHVFPYDSLVGAEISFCMMDGMKCRTDNTGTGHANEIYGTVVALIREVAGTLKLNRIAYDAGDVQRKNIYPALIKKALPGWSLAEHEDDYYYFDQPNINEEVAEDDPFIKQTRERLKGAERMGFDVHHIWYHGTDETFFKFNTSAKSKNRSGNPPGIYLTPYKDEAKGYGKHIQPLYVRIKNPYVYGSSPVTNDMVELYRKVLTQWYEPKWIEDAIIPEFMKSGRFKEIAPESKRDIMLAGGYDSWKDGRHLVVFDPKNVRSIHADFNTSDSDDLVAEGIVDEAPLPTEWDKQVYTPQTSYKKRIEYAVARAQKLGKGSSRTVFEIPYQGRMTVLKVAHNGKGMAQNEAEAAILDDWYVKQGGLVIPVIDYDEDHEQPVWLHTEKAQKANVKQLCALLHTPDLGTLIKYGSMMVGIISYNQTYMNNVQKLVTETHGEDGFEIFAEYAGGLGELATNNDVDLRDFNTPRNWGIYNGNPVVIDIGFTKDVATQYYSEELNEGVSSVLYHYTKLNAAVKIVNDNQFVLTSSIGNKSEEKLMPNGYSYYLSTTRTKMGGYHKSPYNGEVMFNLDGDWYNKRYKGSPVDYWQDKNNDYGRAHEAEDRLFSREPTIPGDGITSIHVYLTLDKDIKHYGSEIKTLFMLAKTRNIPIFLYSDPKAWVNQDQRKVISISSILPALKDHKKEVGRMYRGSNFNTIKNVLELIYKNSTSQLSKDADKLAYNLLMYSDTFSGIEADMFNARKPSSTDRPYLDNLIKAMKANGWANTTVMGAELKDKWAAIQKKEYEARK